MAGTGEAHGSPEDRGLAEPGEGVAVEGGSGDSEDITGTSDSEQFIAKLLIRAQSAFRSGNALGLRSIQRTDETNRWHPTMLPGTGAFCAGTIFVNLPNRDAQAVKALWPAAQVIFEPISRMVFSMTPEAYSPRSVTRKHIDNGVLAVHVCRKGMLARTRAVTEGTLQSLSFAQDTAPTRQRQILPEIPHGV